MWWTLFMISMSVVFVLDIIYLVFKIGKLLHFKHKKLIALAILIGFNILFSIIFSVVNAIVITLHYVLFYLIFDLIFFIIKKIRKQEYKHDYVTIIVLILVPIYLGIGMYNEYHVKRTEYTIETNKLNEDLKVVLFSDSHLGVTLNKNNIQKQLDRIQDEDPDILLIVGDYVDDDTKKEDMIEVTKKLGEIKTKYGIYFVNGNHDKAYFGEDDRGFSVNDLKEEFKNNGIIVLEDESILINDEFYLIGRKDYRFKSRKSIEELTSDLDKDKYMLVMDHQPTDYDNEAKEKVDLVVSGHTHGGQLIPITYINTLVSDNYSVYGLTTKEDTNFIVSSGISAWQIKFKTGCFSEYVVVNIEKK